MRNRIFIAAVAGLLAAVFAVPAGADRAAVAVNSPNLTHVANLKYPDELRKAARLNVGDWQGGTDLEFATIAVADDTAGKKGRQAPGLARRGREQLRDFAIAGTYQNGMQIVDITDPENPALAATYGCDLLQGDVQVFTRETAGVTRTFATYTADVAAKDSPCTQDVLAATGQSFSLGTIIVEITDPYAPKAVGAAEIPVGSHNMTVHPSGLWMYNSDNDAGAQLEVWSLADLTQPTKVFTLPLQQASSDTHDITFSSDGNRAYVASITHSYILDTSTPEAPTLLGTIVDPAVGIHHQADPITMKDPITGQDRTYIIINDEMGGAAGNGYCPGGGLHVYDATGPLERAPVKVGAFFMPELTVQEGAPTGAAGTVTCTAHVFRIYPEQQKLVIAWFSGGVRVVDLSNLVGLRAGAQNVSTGAVAGMNEVGYNRFPDSDVWAAKVHRWDADGSAYIFGNDQTRGFDVFRFTAAATPAAAQGRWLTPEQTVQHMTQVRARLGTSFDDPYCLLRTRGRI